METSEDFGSRGERPTHPELLDWLATEFIRDGWSMKRMHRLIVLSATYRQAPNVTPALLERDPYNRLVARGPRIRLSGRGSARYGAGRERTIEPQNRRRPASCRRNPTAFGIRRTATKNGRRVAAKTTYRRGLYTFWKRTSPYPSFMSF